MANDFTVDVLSLEDFRKGLADRVADFELLFARLNDGASRENPPFGSFVDGTTQMSYYASMREEFITAADRLRKAVEVLHTGTGEIIDAYRTTEDLQKATVADISDKLGDISILLATYPREAASW